jgi:hypothetical protein
MTLKEELANLERIEDPHRRGGLFETFLARLLEEDGFKVNSNPKVATPHLIARTIIRLDMMTPNGSCCTRPMAEILLAAFYPHCDKVQSSDWNFLTQRCERQLAQITEPHSPR